ncbi:MAG: stage II sporulation protein P [Kyrpidia sp.]|nr:stage II sporulation protein P [Kyrpidia sp.]
MRKPSPFRVVTFRTPRRGPGASVSAWLIVVSAVLLMTALVILGPQPTEGAGILGAVDPETWSAVVHEGMPLMARSTDPGGVGDRPSWVASLFDRLTEVDPAHPSSILGWTVPGMAFSDYPIALDSRAVDLRPPDDGSPSPGLFRHEQPAPPNTSGLPSTSSDPLVYIYHTHNRESFLPMLPGRTRFDDAYDKTKNITLVGARLVEDLKQRGIPAVQTTVDYYPMGDYSKEYAFSRKTVEDVLHKYPSLQMIFDVHRDSDPRDLTTTTINDQTYAKVRFIIGGNNPDHAANEQLAEAMKSKLDQLYPHLVRDIWAKRSTTYDATYNQDLSPNMVLIEIGGPENTEAELDRTASCLADAVAALLKDRAAAGLGHTTP